jgi:FkbM family methyltransferase
MADEKTPAVRLETGTWAATLGLLIQKGLRFGSFIDIGSADGYFGLAFWRGGMFRDMTIVNIDANPVYEPSLRKIRDAIGGDYRICAVDEREGTLELHASTHPYWGSALPPDDPYWKAVDGKTGQAANVPCRRLDAIVDELAPPPPYAIKLDIQGLEARALRSGPRALANTAAVVCEVIAQNFREIHAVLEGAGFELYDLTDVNRSADYTLGWFYATYLHRDYAALRTPTNWAAGTEAAILEQQHRRRADMLAKIDALTAKINAERHEKESN